MRIIKTASKMPGEADDEHQFRATYVMDRRGSTNSGPARRSVSEARKRSTRRSRASRLIASGRAPRFARGRAYRARPSKLQHRRRFAGWKRTEAPSSELSRGGDIYAPLPRRDAPLILQRLSLVPKPERLKRWSGALASDFLWWHGMRRRMASARQSNNRRLTS